MRPLTLAHVLALFRRPVSTTRDGLIAHDSARDRLLDLVRQAPGLPIGELAQRLGLSSGTVHYHLARLEAEDAVHTVTGGRRRFVFPGRQGPAMPDVGDISLLRGRTCGHVARAVLRNPGCSVSEVIRHTGESPRAVYYHVKLLVEANLLVPASPHRYREIYPAPHLERVLAALAGETLLQDDVTTAPDRAR